MYHTLAAQCCRFPAQLVSHSRSMGDSKQKSSLEDLPESVFDAWFMSRKVPGQDGILLVPGSLWALNATNARLALYVARRTSYAFVR